MKLTLLEEQSFSLNRLLTLLSDTNVSIQFIPYYILRNVVFIHEMQFPESMPISKTELERYATKPHL